MTDFATTPGLTVAGCEVTESDLCQRCHSVITGGDLCDECIAAGQREDAA